MKLKQLLILCLVCVTISVSGQKQSAAELSQDMMTSFKMSFPVTEYETQLSEIPFQSLVDELNTDAKKQAFWLNVYIVYSQKLISENEPNGCDKSCKKKKIINIAGKMFSLNDILYGILLNSKSTNTRGKKVFVPAAEKELRASFPDGRILLAIDSASTIVNEVTYYEAENLNEQLNAVSWNFLVKYVDYNADRNEVTVPKWIKNFKREFGKKQGMYSGLVRAGVIPENTAPKIVYSDKIATLK